MTAPITLQKNIPPTPRRPAGVPRIVVVGGGAGGLELVTRLGQQLGKTGRAEIVLVDLPPED